MTKEQVLVQLLGAGLSNKQAQLQAGCSRALVFQVKKAYKAEIDSLRAGNPAPTIHPSTIPTPKPPPAVIIMPPSATANISVPVLDPTKDEATQLRPWAWSIIAQGAAGASISKTQKEMALSIIKASDKSKIAPPSDREFVFKLDEIDIIDDKTVVVATHTYQVKP